MPGFFDYVRERFQNQEPQTVRAPRPEVTVESQSDRVGRAAKLADKLGYGHAGPEDYLGLSPSDLAFALNLAQYTIPTAAEQDRQTAVPSDGKVYISDEDLADKSLGPNEFQVMPHEAHQLDINRYGNEAYGLRGIPGTPSDADERQFGPYVDFVDKHGYVPQLFNGKTYPEAARIIAGQLTARRKRLLGTADPSFQVGPLL